MTLVRRILEVVLVVYVFGALTLAVAAQMAPQTGHGLYTVRSRSMAPALGVGDLIVVERVAPEEVRPGDVIAFRLASGTTVTHRVVSVTATDEGPMLTTKGDANATPDPVATRAEQLQGRLATSVALLGFVLAMLSMPIGIAALFSIGASLLTVLWLLDELTMGAEDVELEELARVIEAGTAVGLAAARPPHAATP